MTDMQRTDTRSKIRELDDLAVVLADLRRQGRRVVHCHGVFDLLHIGHIRSFKAARGFGDVLVVTLTPDQHVNKGPHRPAFTQALRAEALAALDCVDFVAVNRWPTAVRTIALLRPDVYVKGSEYRDPANDLTGKIVDETEAVRAVGGEIRFTDEITFSSSRLVNRYLSPFPDEVRDYLQEFSSRRTEAEVIGYLEGARSLRVLAVGETIIDEYHYCDTMGKSGKEPVLAARFVSSEKFAGGILAVANHLASFSDNVGLISFLGDTDSHEDFIRQRLAPPVRPRFLVQRHAPTIVKRRYVELYPLQKLFEIYTMNGAEENPEDAARLKEALAEALPAADLVVVADYGHGMLDRETIDLLCEKARFLALNVQVNAGNMGFNTVSKYPRADLVCVSEKEARMDARSRKRPLEDIVEEISGRLSCPRVLLTQGSQGCLCYESGAGFARIPALTGHIVDRVGAGDTVLSVASLCAAQGAPMEITGFIGNAAGAQAVGTVCNARAVSRTALQKHIVSLMK
jgi:rfaE bifunctional protein kinase chain/domain/rfaE bifunctional protein nucleotidyltransferase chain/domain